MQNKKIAYTIVLVAVFLFFAVTYFFLSYLPRNNAPQNNENDTALETKNNTYQKLSLPSDIDVFNTEIIQKNEHDVKIGFWIKNDKEYSQSGIQYVVNLHKFDRPTPETVYLIYPIDRLVYEDRISIGGGEQLKKEISYSIPSYLQGTYHLSIELFQEKSGFFLERADIGEVQISGSNNFVEIDPQTCYVTVESGDKKSEEKYGLMYGVDIASEEKLIGHCLLKNHFDYDVTVLPQFQNYYRKDFLGNKVEQEVGVFESVAIAAKEEKEILLNIPRAQKPQAYDASLVLVDLNKNPVSNKISFHYVLSGQSATIHSIQSDKYHYKKNDIAHISVRWSGSADKFPEARFLDRADQEMIMEVRAYDVQGKECGLENKQISLAGNDGKEEILLPMNNCEQPVFAAKIRNADGKILDQKEFLMQAPLQMQEGVFKKYVYFGTGFIICMLLIYTLIRKQHGKSAFGISCFLLLLGLCVTIFSQVHKGDATDGQYDAGNGCTFYAMCGNTHCYGSCNGSVTRTNYPWDAIGPDKPLCEYGSPSPHNPTFPEGKYEGESKVTWDCIRSDYSAYGCSAQRLAPPSEDGACNTTTEGSYNWYDTAFRGSLCTTGTPTINQNTDFPAYGATVTWGCNGIGTGTSTAQNACTATRAINPACACGSADKSTSLNAPSSNLCTIGNASPVAGSNGTWSWTCGTPYTYNTVLHQCTDQKPCTAECVDVDLDMPTQIYVTDGENTVNAHITISNCSAANNIDCNIAVGGTNYPVPFAGTSCTSNTVSIPFAGPSMTAIATCDMHVTCGGGGGSGEKHIEKPFTIQGMCAERSCTNQGTCQAVPKSAASPSDCHSTCSTDADCSR